jgi:hypothetical protein
MSPEPSESSEPPTHTIDATVIPEPVSEWPAEDDVLKHARSYPGNLALGVPAQAITEGWATDYWTWRTFDEERWPKRWREEMFRRFEREWRNGGRAVRGSEKKASAPAVAGGKHSEWAPPPALSSGAVDLNAMRVVTAESPPETRPSEEEK